MTINARNTDMEIGQNDAIGTKAAPQSTGNGKVAEISAKCRLSTVQEKRAARLASVPRRYRDLYKRAYTGKSRKAAVRAFCLECVQWQTAEVHRCTAPACPLYPYRPIRDDEL